MAQKLTIENKFGGLQDYSTHLMDATQLYTHENNQPQNFSFRLQDLGESDFIVPTRGSYVVFEDNRFESRDEGVPDGVIFTGYISDEPRPVFLGVKGGGSVFAYEIQAVSEDYLPQIKNLPSKIYVNKTRGFIIRDVVKEMFLLAGRQPLDTSGVREGGIERLYQTDPNKRFADMLAEFAKSDAFRYRAIYGKLFYEPEVEMLPGASDPQVKLAIDEEDPRFTPANLGIERVATSIVNDVTVYGEEEPTTLMVERYVSDGYQGQHRLLFNPYGVESKVLVQDDFTAPAFDTAIWDEEDDELALTGVGDGSYLQMFEGSFNIVGGEGSHETPAIWLRSRRGIEMSGILQFRDCEIFFAPGSTGSGLVGGLFSDENMKLSSCFSGWYVTPSGPWLSPILDGDFLAPDGSLNYAIILDGNHHYILRRRFEFDTPIGLSSEWRGPRETEVVYGAEEQEVNGWVTYSIEHQDITDPQNIVITKSEIASVRITNVPEFVLYAPVVSYSLHAVMNFCKVERPQQVRVEVDGITIPLGDFMDGGLATVVTEDDGSYLKWYSIPTSTGGGGTPAPIVSAAPWAYWRLGESGTFIADNGTTTLYPMEQTGPFTLVPGAPNGTSDQGRYFFDGGHAFGPVTGSEQFFDHSSGAFPVPYSITGWVKTTASRGPIWSHNSLAYSYTAVWVENGRISARVRTPEEQLTGNKIVNDGQWHHFAMVHDAVINEPGTTRVYVDGVLDVEGPQHLWSPIAVFPWSIGYDKVWWNSLGGFIIDYFTGAIDDVKMYDVALTATQVNNEFQLSQQPGGAAPPPAYNPQTGVTIPPQGSKVDITYYRAEQARARIKSTTSIASERARFGDDGIRQHIVLADDVFPRARTSDECQFLGQAFLADRANHRYEGTYIFDTGERDVTRLDVLPAPGDLIPCRLGLNGGEVIDTNLHCTRVALSFAGEGAYAIELGVGPINRFDEAQRKLLLARKSSMDNPEIKSEDVLVAEVLSSVGYSIPATPRDVLISNVTPLTFTVNMNPNRVAAVGGYGAGGGTEVNGDLPEGVVGYEIRRGDSGWGQGNYVARVSAATFTLNRGTRDRAYFVRPFNEQGNYSRHSALVRVISPLSNTLTATGLDGDISGDAIRLYIPITRNPDIGGWLVQKSNADGPVLYQGDGINHRTIISGATVLVESNRVTISFPVSSGATTVRVLTYNLLGEFGPELIFTITRLAPVI